MLRRLAQRLCGAKHKEKNLFAKEMPASFYRATTTSTPHRLLFLTTASSLMSVAEADLITYTHYSSLTLTYDLTQWTTQHLQALLDFLYLINSNINEIASNSNSLVIFAAILLQAAIVGLLIYKLQVFEPADPEPLPEAKTPVISESKEMLVINRNEIRYTDLQNRIENIKKNLENKKEKTEIKSYEDWMPRVEEIMGLIKDEFTDHIGSFEIMRDPVSTLNGRNFERNSLLRFFNNKQKCPIDGVDLPMELPKTNKGIVNTIEQLLLTCEKMVSQIELLCKSTLKMNQTLIH